MSVDKAKDTSPKKPITENKIVEAKPESSTKTKNKPDLYQKNKVWARVKSQYPKPTRTIGTTFLGRRKSDSTCRTAWGTYAAAAVLMWSFAGGVGRGCQCSYK